MGMQWSFAIDEMIPAEHEAGICRTPPLLLFSPFPLRRVVSWENNRDPAPTPSNSLKIAQRRAEALNRLYKTDRADKEYVAWPVGQ
jgi:hypothetical protein